MPRVWVLLNIFTSADSQVVSLVLCCEIFNRGIMPSTPWNILGIPWYIVIYEIVTLGLNILQEHLYTIKIFSWTWPVLYQEHEKKYYFILSVEYEDNNHITKLFINCYLFFIKLSILYKWKFQVTLQQKISSKFCIYLIILLLKHLRTWWIYSNK